MSENLIKGTIMITTAKFFSFYFYIIVSTAGLIFLSFMHVLNILNIPKKTTDWLGLRIPRHSSLTPTTFPHQQFLLCLKPHPPLKSLLKYNCLIRNLRAMRVGDPLERLFFKCAVLSPCNWASLNLYTSQSTKMVALIILSIVYLFTFYFN